MWLGNRVTSHRGTWLTRWLRAILLALYIGNAAARGACSAQLREQNSPSSTALGRRHTGGSRQLELAVAHQARQADDVSKYAPSELEAEDVGVPHAVDLVLDEVVVDEALAAKRALSAASSKKNRGARTARKATATRAARVVRTTARAQARRLPSARRCPQRATGTKSSRASD
ncbi:hypothetical protein T492DRAFT_938113, partial [Pavlovales sp. CCMP2436]